MTELRVCDISFDELWNTETYRIYRNIRNYHEQEAIAIMRTGLITDELVIDSSGYEHSIPTFDLINVMNELVFLEKYDLTAWMAFRILSAWHTAMTLSIGLKYIADKIKSHKYFRDENFVDEVTALIVALTTRNNDFFHKEKFMKPLVIRKPGYKALALTHRVMEGDKLRSSLIAFRQMIQHPIFDDPFHGQALSKDIMFSMLKYAINQVKEILRIEKEKSNEEISSN